VESCEFSAVAKDFSKAGYAVIGISADSVASQKKFETKEKLTVPLLSDPEKGVLKAYDMFGEKTMYGKKVIGIIRSTVVIGKDGKVVKRFGSVKTAGHAGKVLEFVKGV
jgi:peroxiredoxin Q/BCP